MKLFTDGKERQQAIVISAGVALHALIASKRPATDEEVPGLVRQAFVIAKEYWKQAEELPV